MAHFIVPFLEESFRPLVWDYEPFSGRSWNELARLAQHVDAMRQQCRDGVSRRKDAFEVDLDVHGFTPKDLNISVQDNMLTVEGKHEEKSEDGSSYSSRQFIRSFRVPENVQVDQFKSKLARDGRTLRIEAPLVKPAVEEAKNEEPKEVEIAINHVKSAGDGDAVEQ
jgi:HSP20 family molecular chaperone IbpA